MAIKGRAACVSFEVTGGPYRRSGSRPRGDYRTDKRSGRSLTPRSDPSVTAGQPRSIPPRSVRDRRTAPINAGKANAVPDSTGHGIRFFLSTSVQLSPVVWRRRWCFPRRAGFFSCPATADEDPAEREDRPLCLASRLRFRTCRALDSGQAVGVLRLCGVSRTWIFY